jgi:hypothetical protein
MAHGAAPCRATRRGAASLERHTTEPGRPNNKPMWKVGSRCYHPHSHFEETVSAVQQGSFPNSKPKEEAANHQYKSPSLSYNRPRQAEHDMKANINNKNIAKMESKYNIPKFSKFWNVKKIK